MSYLLPKEGTVNNRSVMITIVLLAVALFFSSCDQTTTSSEEAKAPVEVKAAGWVKEVADHLVYESQIEDSVAKRLNLEQPKCYTVVLEENGEPVALHDLTQGNALLCAAECYALTTRDFDVQVRDVIDNGYYPFLDLPDSVKPEMSIIHNGNQKQVFTDKALQDIGTNQWMISVKNLVLQDYYTVCFLAHCTGCTGEQNIPDDYITTIPRNPAFWVNPMTSAPMAESAQPGDYRIVDKEGFLSSMIVPMIESSTTTKRFICINNEWDSRQLLSKATSDTQPEMCCFIGTRITTIPANEVNCTPYNVTCKATGRSVICQLCWQFPAETTRFDRKVKVSKCQDWPIWPGYSILPLPCPVGDTPFCSDVYHYGLKAEIVPTFCLPPACTGLELIEEPDPDDIKNSLKNEGTYYTDISSPMHCDCPTSGTTVS
jgi:hypothetical protein